MGIPAGFIPPTGKDNVMSSLNQFLVSEIGGGEVHDGISTTLSGGNDFWWFFDYPLGTLEFPAISVHESGLFTNAPRAMDRVLGWDTSTGKPVKGDQNQTLIEINCWAKDIASKADGTQVVRQLRDKVFYVLKNAAEIDEDTGLHIISPIEIKDFTQGGNPVVGILHIDTADNSIDEKYIVDEADRNIKRYRLLVRAFWDELVS